MTPHICADCGGTAYAYGIRDGARIYVCNPCAERWREWMDAHRYVPGIVESLKESV